MTIALMEKLHKCGWYLTEYGFDLVTDHGNITDIQRIVKRASEYDLKEISSGEGDLSQGDVVLQIQKLRNVSAPKNNEESFVAPRLLRLSLTDGKNSFQAIEIENITFISLNIPPGTKLLIRRGTLLMSHGILLLKSHNIICVFRGEVANLVEKWELNKKLAFHTRVRSVDEGGPPQWIPFGKKIIKITENGKNFKAIAEKEKATDENAEFEIQRKNAIAEAAKHGSKKVFGGGNKQLLDHSVQKIVDQGFSIEQAEYALKITRNNIDRALKTLHKSDSKANSNPKITREPRESKGKRSDKKNDEISGKPSSGKISLFDFVEDKLPIHSVTAGTHTSYFLDTTRKESNEMYFDHYSKSNEHFEKDSRNSRSNRGFQNQLRHKEENRLHRNSNSEAGNQQHGQYGSIDSQKAKPPRFQKNQEIQNFNKNKFNHQQDPIRYDKITHVNEFKSIMPTALSLSQSERNVNTLRHISVDGAKINHQDCRIKNQLEYETKVINNSNNQNSELNNDLSDFARDVNEEPYQPYSIDANQRGYQLNHHYKLDDQSHDYSKMGGLHVRGCSNHYNKCNRNKESSVKIWTWQVGDRCMAKYWEDNMYYNAEVTAVSKTTCVVLFKDFDNYEEVLQIDCIPITESDFQNRQDGHQKLNHRVHNRPPRFEQNQTNFSATEYRQADSGSSNKNYRRRGQQRSTQPIYQPPAQRGNIFLS